MPWQQNQTQLMNVEHLLINVEHLLQGRAQACTLRRLHIVDPHLQKHSFLGRRTKEQQNYSTASNLAERLQE
jgi:hypothetical protein